MVIMVIHAAHTTSLLLTPQTPAEQIQVRLQQEESLKYGKSSFDPLTIIVAVVYCFGKRHTDELRKEDEEGPHEDREYDQQKHNVTASGSAVIENSD